jgi:hypothetical protein
MLRAGSLRSAIIVIDENGRYGFEEVVVTRQVEVVERLARIGRWINY